MSTPTTTRNGINLTYRCPPFWEDEKTKISWVQRMLEQGEGYLARQRGFEDIETAKQIIAGDDRRRPSTLSQLKVNRVKRQVREVVATLSNIRPLWGYKSDNQEYDQQTEILNKLILSWWHTSFADRAIREALQWAAVCGTGYVEMTWERDLWTTGRGDATLKVHGPKDVIPFHIGRDNNLQRAYAVAIRKEVPLSVAHAMWPSKAHLIKADYEAPTWLGKTAQSVQRFASPVLNAVGVGNVSRAEPRPFATVDIYDIYVLDFSINTTGKDLCMGEPDTNWYYEVPYLGKQVGTGMFSPTGEEVLHTVGEEEARLYPRRRLITCTREHVIADGPSPWWHGMVPLVQFRLDDWPWEFLGGSLVKDTASINDSNNSILRAVVDAANVRLRPPVRYDASISRGLMAKFDPRQPNVQIKVDSATGVQDPIKPIFDPAQFDVPEWVLEFVQQQEQRADYLVGVQDLTALAKAQQTPSADSIEKLEQLAGPLVTDMSRNMERSLRDIGDLFKSMVFQFYTTPRKFQMLGADGLTEEDFDYNPDSMVPDFLPWENQHKQVSNYTEHQRAQWHQNNFVFHVTPNSLHQITQMTRKLLYLQLQKSGIPIDPWTMAEVFDIPNFGKPPSGANTVLERWEAWLAIQAKIQEALAMQQMMSGLGGLAAAGGAAGLPGAGGQPGPGRPNTFEKPPRVEEKDQNSPDGPRTTTTTS